MIRFTEGVGGNNNGGTNYDQTGYYENVPSNYVEHAMWMEADRMGWLLDALDTTKYNAQRSIVQQERKQRVDNVPFGTAREIMLANMYPSTNPYSWDVIGHLADLQAAPIDAVKDFFREYYAPNNATVAIVGDFDPATALAMVKKYFGDVPRGKAIPRPKVAPVTLTEEKRLTFEDKGVTSSPRLYLSWPTADAHNPDQYALSVLQSVLTGSRTARLTKELVYDRQLAASVSANQNTLEDAGQFGITITPRPNVSLTQLELITDSILDRFKREGPTADEVTRAKAGLELGFISALESNLGKANAMASDQATLGDPSHSFNVDYPKTQAVTPADVKRVATKYLTKGRIVLSVVPVAPERQGLQARVEQGGDRNRRRNAMMRADFSFMAAVGLTVLGSAGLSAQSRRQKPPSIGRLRRPPVRILSQKSRNGRRRHCRMAPSSSSSNGTRCR